MEYNGEGIEALVSVLDDLQNSNIIMADKKLRAMLKCLAYYDEFRMALSYCNQGFDFDAEKKRAFQRIGERKVFKIPRNPKTLIALVCGLLLQFDNGEMDYVTFASEYFPADTKQESLQMCATAVLEPFKLALVSLVVDGVEEEAVVAPRDVEFASIGLQQQTEYLLVAFVNTVQDAQISAELRADLMLMLEGLAAALDMRDTLMIRAMWLGVKHALAGCKLSKKECDKMDELLRLYLVVR